MVVSRRVEAEAYIDKEGEPRAALKLTADAVKFLDAKGGERTEAAEGKDEIPF